MYATGQYVSLKIAKSVYSIIDNLRPQISSSKANVSLKVRLGVV